MVHLTFLVRQLACAIARGSVDNCRRHDFGISALASLIEEEVDESTLQTCTLTDVYGESCTGNLHAQVEVDEVVLLGEFPVGQGIGNTQRRIDVPVADSVVTIALLQVRLYHVIVFSGSTLGHLVVRNIGNLTKQTSHLVLRQVHRLLQLFVGLLHLRHLCLDSLGLVLLAFLHETANLCSHLLGFSQVLVQLLLSLTTTLVDCQHLVDSLLGAFEMFLLQSANDAFCFLCNEFQCKHLVINYLTIYNLRFIFYDLQRYKNLGKEPNLLAIYYSYEA